MERGPRLSSVGAGTHLPQLCTSSVVVQLQLAGRCLGTAAPQTHCGAGALLFCFVPCTFLGFTQSHKSACLVTGDTRYPFTTRDLTKVKSIRGGRNPSSPISIKTNAEGRSRVNRMD